MADLINHGISEQESKLVNPLRRSASSLLVVKTDDRAFAPHCDQSILHSPGECEYCDKYPDWQEMRERQRINFTGHFSDNKAPCPSHYFRDPEKVESWSGNLPTKMKDEIEKDLGDIIPYYHILGD